MAAGHVSENALCKIQFQINGSRLPAIKYDVRFLETRIESRDSTSDRDVEAQTDNKEIFITC